MFGCRVIGELVPCGASVGARDVCVGSAGVGFDDTTLEGDLDNGTAVGIVIGPKVGTMDPFDLLFFDADLLFGSGGPFDEPFELPLPFPELFDDNFEEIFDDPFPFPLPFELLKFGFGYDFDLEPFILFDDGDSVRVGIGDGQFEGLCVGPVLELLEEDLDDLVFLLLELFWLALLGCIVAVGKLEGDSEGDTEGFWDVVGRLVGLSLLLPDPFLDFELLYMDLDEKILSFNWRYRLPDERCLVCLLPTTEPRTT